MRTTFELCVTRAINRRAVIHAFSKNSEKSIVWLEPIHGSNPDGHRINFSKYQQLILLSANRINRNHVWWWQLHYYLELCNIPARKKAFPKRSKRMNRAEKVSWIWWLYKLTEYMTHMQDNNIAAHSHVPAKCYSSIQTQLETCHGLSKSASHVDHAINCMKRWIYGPFDSHRRWNYLILMHLITMPIAHHIHIGIVYGNDAVTLLEHSRIRIKLITKWVMTTYSPKLQRTNSMGVIRERRENNKIHTYKSYVKRRDVSVCHSNRHAFEELLFFGSWPYPFSFLSLLFRL